MTIEQARENKETIEWWLNNLEKGVLKKPKCFPNDKWKVTKMPSWYFTRFKYVINDSLFEIRQAVADGKRIQVLNQIVNDTYLWEDCDGNNLCTEHTYRIRPFIKFNIGDFVRYNGKPCIVSSISLSSNTVHVKGINFEVSEASPDDLVEWAPEPLDVCWFYYTGDVNPVLGQFVRTMDKNISYSCSNSKSRRGYIAFTFCEPFLGTTPKMFNEIV